jgi:hypothetical protein
MVAGLSVITCTVGAGEVPAARHATSRPMGMASGYDAQVAVDWFNLLYEVIRIERLSPPVAARLIGYQSVILYESLVPGMPLHRSLGGQLNELEPPARRGGPALHWPSVANGALARGMRSFLPAASPASLTAINLQEEQIALQVTRRVPARVKAASVQRGREEADRVIQWAAGDGYAAANNCAYTPPAGDGLWEPTPPLFRPALQPCWGSLRPFVLTSGSECAPPPPPAFSTAPDSAFHLEALEVYQAGTSLTDEQKAIAQFWSDDPGNTGTPPGHWISIVGQIAQRDGLSLAEAAEAYARVGIAVADSFVACWDAKFQHNLLRPVTYIQDHVNAAWLPLLGTPPFPEYTSGHSTQSAAAALVLGDMLGTVSFTDRTHETRGLEPRSFASFDEAAAEAAISRLYGGIHYRAAIERGMDQGSCIGGAILDRVQFRKR